MERKGNKETQPLKAYSIQFEQTNVNLQSADRIKAITKKYSRHNFLSNHTNQLKFIFADIATTDLSGFTATSFTNQD